MASRRLHKLLHLLKHKKSRRFAEKVLVIFAVLAVAFGILLLTGQSVGFGLVVEKVIDAFADAAGDVAGDA